MEVNKGALLITTRVTADQWAREEHVYVREKPSRLIGSVRKAVGVFGLSEMYHVTLTVRGQFTRVRAPTGCSLITNMQVDKHGFITNTMTFDSLSVSVRYVFVGCAYTGTAEQRELEGAGASTSQ